MDEHHPPHNYRYKVRGKNQPGESRQQKMIRVEQRRSNYVADHIWQRTKFKPNENQKGTNAAPTVRLANVVGVEAVRPTHAISTRKPRTDTNTVETAARGTDIRRPRTHLGNSELLQTGGEKANGLVSGRVVTGVAGNGSKTLPESKPSKVGRIVAGGIPVDDQYIFVVGTGMIDGLGYVPYS